MKKGTSQERAVEMNHLKGACGVTGWEGESDESVYEKYSMETCANSEKKYLMWFGHLKRKKSRVCEESVCE